MPAETGKREELRLVTAVEAIAYGLIDGGLSLITNFPGSQSHEISEHAGGTVTSVTEKTAYAVAWGASLAGRRSAVTMKNVGLNDAADALLNSMLLHVNAGLVVVVIDDIDVEGSQIRLDSRHYFNFFGGLWLEPRTTVHAYELARDSFELSERFSVPVVIRCTNAVVHQSGHIARLPRHVLKKRFVRDSRRFVAHPKNVTFQEERLRARQREISDYVESLVPSVPMDPNQQILNITFGAANPFETAPASNWMSLFTLPLPQQHLRRVLNNSRQVEVHEHGDPVVTDMVTNLMAPHPPIYRGYSSLESVQCYHDSDRFETIFKALRSFDDRIVCGDLGQYTMDPHRTIDACLCFGASVGVATGAAIGDPSLEVFCVTGDGAFCHSGRNSLYEAVARGAHFTVIIIDNGGSQTTGGQQIPGELTVQPLGIEAETVRFGRLTTEELLSTLRRMGEFPGVSVVRVLMS